MNRKFRKSILTSSILATLAMGGLSGCVIKEEEPAPVTVTQAPPPPPPPAPCRPLTWSCRMPRRLRLSRCNRHRPVRNLSGLVDFGSGTEGDTFGATAIITGRPMVITIGCATVGSMDPMDTFMYTAIGVEINLI